MKKRSRATSRRENKRLDQKRVRAAEREVLHGGKTRKVYRGHRPTLVEGKEPQPKKRKKEKKKNPCPATGKRHEYLEDTRRVPTYHGVFQDGEWREVEDGEREERYKLCVHCGREMVKRYKYWREVTWWDWWYKR